MTFQSPASAFFPTVETFAEPARKPNLPAHSDVADPESGWATRNPERAMLFLYVSPRDCDAVGELMAA